MKTTKLKYQIDSEGTWLSALVRREDAMSCLENYEEGKEYELEVKKAKGKKRSLDANNYAWTLIDKIAVETHIPKTEVYRHAIREIGGNSFPVCVKTEAVDSLISGWERNGLGWQVETYPSRHEGFTNANLYWGSSTYDTKTMSRLIEYIVADAKELGIETLTPRELAQLESEWGQ